MWETACQRMADQNYTIIYDALVKNLNDNEVCIIIQVCPRQAGNQLTEYIASKKPTNQLETSNVADRNEKGC